LEASLTDLGWGGTFAITIGIAAALAVIAYAVVRDRPAGVPAPQRHHHAPLAETIAAAWHRPTTRRAFYAHLGTLGPFAAIGTVWGVPYLEHSQHLSGATAASLMLPVAITFTASMPLVGFTGHWGPRARGALLVVPGTLLALGLAVLLAWPGTVVPRGLLIGVLALVGLAAAVSLSCFDIARRATPRPAVGITVAIVNCGGFTGAAVGSAVIGLWLGGDPSPARFEQAVLGVVLVITAIGVVGSTLLTRDMTVERQREALRQPSQTPETSAAAASP
jgi:Na+/melibiose symporter-like transporter